MFIAIAFFVRKAGIDEFRAGWSGQGTEILILHFDVRNVGLKAISRTLTFLRDKKASNPFRTREILRMLKKVSKPRYNNKLSKYRLNAFYTYI
jgi:hypothetical protein